MHSYTSRFLFTLKNPTASAEFEPTNLGTKGLYWVIEHNEVAIIQVKMRSYLSLVHLYDAWNEHFRNTGTSSDHIYTLQWHVFWHKIKSPMKTVTWISTLWPRCNFTPKPRRMSSRKRDKGGLLRFLLFCWLLGNATSDIEDYLEHTKWIRSACEDKICWIHVIILKQKFCLKYKLDK